MAAEKYLTLVGTQQTLKSSNDVSSGVGDAGKLVALDSTGKLNSTLLPAGIGETSQVFTAAESIAANAVVSITSAGTIQNADASTQRAAAGFTTSAIANGASGTVFLSGQITGLAGLTPGAKLFVGAAGAVSASAPTTAGFIWQRVARATSATSAEFLPEDPILLA